MTQTKWKGITTTPKEKSVKKSEDIFVLDLTPEPSTIVNASDRPFRFDNFISRNNISSDVLSLWHHKATTLNQKEFELEYMIQVNIRVMSGVDDYGRLIKDVNRYVESAQLRASNVYNYINNN